MFCSNNSGYGILELCKAISAKQLAFLPVKDEAAAKNCQDLRLLNSLSGLQVAFCGVNFVKFIFHNIFFEGSMCWKFWASRSALPSSSLGWKKNKIHAVLEVS